MALILVVDDSQEIRHLVTFSLKAAGYQAVEASSGAEALSLTAELHPDLMILDVMMPGMSGFDVLNELRTCHAGLDLPVILLTARSDLADKEQGFQAGAEDYVTKPFAPRELIMRVAAHLRSKEERDRLREEAHGLEQLSSTDELTGAYNRRHLIQRLAEELSEARRHTHSLALMIVDIDHFKAVNDTHGHPAGDEVLRGLAQLVRDNVRAEDVLARYGGEEFILLMPSTPIGLALAMAERVCQLIGTYRFQVGGHELGITVSVGVAGYPVDNVQSTGEIIDMADKRLYAAKHLGRNRVVGPEAEFPASV